MTRRQLGVVLAAIAFGSGVIDVILRFWTLRNFEQAALMVLHDPSKVTMHLLLLPLAVFVLVDRFPTDFAWGIAGGRDRSFDLFSRTFAWVLAGILVFALGLAMYHDPQSGFCERPPAPEDVRDESTRADMAKQRLVWLQKLRAKSAEFGPASPEHQEYMRLVAKARGDAACSVWQLTTLRGHWAIFLTFQALAAVAVFLWLIVCHVVARRKPSADVRVAFILFVVFLAPWIALRPLSEWLANFGHYDFASYPPWAYAAFVLFFAGVAVMFSVSGKNAGKILAAVAGAGSTILGAMAAFMPGAFDPIAKVFAAQQPYAILGEYVFLILLVVMTVRQLGSDAH